MKVWVCDCLVATTSKHLGVAVNDGAQDFSGPSATSHVQKHANLINIARLHVLYGYPMSPGILDLDDELVHVMFSVSQALLKSVVIRRDDKPSAMSSPRRLAKRTS